MNSIDWINQRRELLDAVTEGTWRPEPLLEFDADGSYELARVLAKDSVDPEHYVIGVVHTGILPGDATFIADARTSLPLALDALEAVLTLHNHEDIHHLTGLVGSYNCLGCGHAGYGKCPTVRRIEAILNKEL